MSRTQAPRSINDGGKLLLDPATHNISPRIIPGFRIQQDTLDHLGPLERAWAKKLIAEGTWRLVLNNEVTR